jgi:exopolysaccharide biosynthesis polyprenyl glycosylphosphotransferase
VSQLNPPPVKRRRKAHIALAADLAALGVATLLASAILSPWMAPGSTLRSLAVGAPAVVLALWVHGLYRSNQLRLVPSGADVLRTVLRSLPLAALGLVGLLLTTGSLHGSSVLAATTAVLVPLAALVPLVRSLVVRIAPRHVQRVLIVGSGESAEAVASRLRRYGGLEVIGMVDDDPLPGFQTIGTLADAPALVAEKGVDRVIVALPRAPWLEVSETLQSLMGPVDIAVVPTLHQLMTWRSGVQDLAGIPLIPLETSQGGRLPYAAKRTLDLVVGSLALVLFAPILLVSVLAIRLDSNGPAVFRQQRIGKGNQPFTILKLRTMHVGAEGKRAELIEATGTDHRWFKLADDPRVTRVGAILRRYSIDELPQLFNVLSGKMSLVGPRPYPVVESGAFQVGSATSRFDMPPGMTGLWQVSGRSDLTWDDLCRLDAIYVKSWSLVWDLRILLQTPAATLRAQGAY